MFPSETPRKIFSRGEKIEFNQKIPDTVGEAFRLPLRTLKKILTSITEADTEIAFPQGLVAIAGRQPFTVARNRRD